MKKLLQRATALGFRLLFRFSFRWRLLPFCHEFGKGRGGSLSRYYVNRFIQKYAPEVRGRVLEFGGKDYECFFDSKKISSYDVFDIEKTEACTIAADLQDCPQIPGGSFDAIICTQVLEHIYFTDKAMSELYRLLAPSGVLLLTVPFHGFIHASPQDFWRFSPEAFKRMIAKYRYREAVFQTFGNVYVAAMYNLGLGMADVRPAMLELKEDRDPLTLTCFARK